MYRICEYYDVSVSYFCLSYDIIFHIYNKNDIFEPKRNITITLIYDHRTYTSDASNENKYFSRRLIHQILSGCDQIAKSNRYDAQFVNALPTPTHAFRPSARNGPLSYNQGVGHHREMERRVYLGGGRAFILSSVFGLSDKRNEQKITSVLSRGVP